MVKTMVYAKVSIVLQAFCLCALSFGQERPLLICLEDRAGLNPPTRASFNKEFALLVASHGLKVDWADCKTATPGTIQLTVEQDAPQSLDDVLGRAYRADNSIGTRLEIFVDPVRDLMKDVPCWSILGRALARVAAHEVGHFSAQQAEHSQRGLMKAAFSGSELSSSDSSAFYWKPGSD